MASKTICDLCGADVTDLHKWAFHVWYSGDAQDKYDIETLYIGSERVHINQSHNDLCMNCVRAIVTTIKQLKDRVVDKGV